MIKRVILVKKADHVTVEDFKQHWFGPHAELVRQLVGLRGYEQNLSLDTSPDRLWDGVAEQWWESEEIAKAAVASPIGQAVIEDAGTFAGQTLVLVLEQRIVISPP